MRVEQLDEADKARAGQGWTRALQLIQVFGGQQGCDVRRWEGVTTMVAMTLLAAACRSVPISHSREALHPGPESMTSLIVRAFNARNAAAISEHCEKGTLVYGPLGGEAQGGDAVRAMLEREFADPRLAGVALRGSSQPPRFQAGRFASVAWQGTVGGWSGASGVRLRKYPADLSFAYRRVNEDWTLIFAAFTLPYIIELAPAGSQ